MGFPLTEEQKRVVEHQGGCLLVSAAAGSGKTRVLVERLLDRVSEQGKDIDDYLVITYTRAAAAELRSRIAGEIAQRLAERPGDRHLRRQASLVYKAQISTIHSLCADLLRECGYLLDLDPDFRMCDEQEGKILRARVLDDLLEQRYEQITPECDFAQLVDILSAGRDDRQLVEIVLDIYDHIQSHPRPRRWLEEQADAFETRGVTDAGETIWGRLLLDDAVRQARYCRDKLELALSLTGANAALEANYAGSIRTTLDGLERFLQAADTWDGAASCLPVPFPAAGRKRTGDCPEAERVKHIRSGCKKRLDKLSGWFEDDSAAVLENLRKVAPAVRGLLTLVSEFSDAFTAEKRRQGILDFPDLEHYAVEILADPETGAPTETARMWSGRYEEIMVDEYQDTNEVQNAIFSALSRDGRNLFLVGDVKQSIYRFRLADPTIFLDRCRRFPPADQAKEGEPGKLVLSRNFRSRPGILSAVNDVFRTIMSTEFGEMEYTAEEMLNPGVPEDAPSGEPCVELRIVECADDDDEGDDPGEKPNRYLLEARHTADRIDQLLRSGCLIRDGGDRRPVRPSDIVILLRSPGSLARYFTQALGERGIPWQADGARDFFAATEVNVALSLLQVIDNPRQDVALISALRSPVYGFTADRLARLRAEDDGDFYSAVRAGAARGEEDCAAFLSELETLRRGAGEKAAHELIWDLYERTNLPAMYAAMPDGEGRRANLMALYELARTGEENGRRGLFSFLTYLSRLMQSGGSVEVPSGTSENGGVRILSIHKAKGLEFPVVFLCGLSKQLNRVDTMKPVLFHPKLGVGPKWLDRDRMVQSPTLARRAAARQLDRELMAEELRLLYVAMTRAKDRLIMTCSVVGYPALLDKLKEDAACPVDPQALLAQDSVGKWLLLSALCRPEADCLRLDWQPSGVPADWFGEPWEIGVYPADTANRAPAAEPARFVSPAGARRDLAQLRESLTWEYPYAQCADIPSKRTATQLKGRRLDEEAAEETPRPRHTGALRRPVFAETGADLTPAQRGAALHLAMQFLDFGKTGSAEEIQGEIRRLAEHAFITPAQAQAVDPRMLYTFFQSPLGQRVKRGGGVHREWKFSLLVPASDYYRDCPPGDEILLQGVVDCWLEEPDGLTLIDFKTDRVTAQTAQQRAGEYRAQMDTYQRALEEITGKKVVRKILWFFTPGCGIPI